VKSLNGTDANKGKLSSIHLLIQQPSNQ